MFIPCRKIIKSKHLVLISTISIFIQTKSIKLNINQNYIESKFRSNKMFSTYAAKTHIENSIKWTASRLNNFLMTTRYLPIFLISSVYYSLLHRPPFLLFLRFFSWLLLSCLVFCWYPLSNCLYFFHPPKLYSSS